MFDSPFPPQPEPVDPYSDPYSNYYDPNSFDTYATDVEGVPPEAVSDIYINKRQKGLATSPVHSDEGLIKTPDHSRHVVLAKKFNLLIIIFCIMVLSGLATAIWVISQSKFGHPPTDFSQTAYLNTMLALISLCLVSLFSIIVLRGKVHHLAIGYILMFSYVLTFYFALKGASRAFTSIKYDDIVTIEDYVFSNTNRSNGELPQFFHHIQTNFECCGTNTIDKMKDWPERLQTKDMPRSCCKKESSTCGRLLARTYDYKGEVNQEMRTPSGYFLSLTENELDEIVRTEKPVKIIRAPGNDKGLETVLKVVKEFYFRLLAETYPPNTPIDDMRRLPNDIIEPFDVDKDNLPTAIGCSDNAALEKVTTIGWQIQIMLDYETSVIQLQSSPPKYDWIAWKIPICQEIAGAPPFHLASNLNREINNVRTDVKHMWYISRGIVENFILKDVIWESNCENEKNLQLIPDSSLVKLIIGKEKRTGNGKTIGKFFISFVHQLMLACLAVSIIAAVFLFIVFLIFWKYYSRMKLEEYANLPYPPEFEALKVRQSDLYVKHVKSEYSKEKARALKEKDEEERLQQQPPLDYEAIGDQFDRMFGSAYYEPTVPNMEDPTTIPHSDTSIMYSDTADNVF